MGAAQPFFPVHLTNAFLSSAGATSSRSSIADTMRAAGANGAKLSASRNGGREW